MLKDASAAAIYESMAVSGVVIVTTNKGSSEGLIVQGRARFGVTKVTNTLDFLNARQYADVRNAMPTPMVRHVPLQTIRNLIRILIPTGRVFN